MAEQVRAQQRVDAGVEVQLEPRWAQILARIATAEPEGRPELMSRLLAEIDRSTIDSAPLLEAALDRGDFDALRDEWGKPVKAAVVGKLVGFGYPYALRISPEALSVWRQSERSIGQPSSGPEAKWVVGIVGVGLIHWGMGSFSIDAGSHALSYVTLPLLLAWLMRARPSWIKVPARALLLLVGLLGTLLGGVQLVFSLMDPPELPILLRLLLTDGLQIAVSAMAVLAARSLQPSEPTPSTE